MNYLDPCRDRLGRVLEAGKWYKLGMAHGNLFAKYDNAFISKVTGHSKYCISYTCHYRGPSGPTFGYVWDKFSGDSLSVRLATAVEITEEEWYGTPKSTYMRIKDNEPD